MPGILHIEHLRRYTKDAEKTQTPWKHWSARPNGGEWARLTGHPVWDIACQYRRDPDFKAINGCNVPMHLTELLPERTHAWLLQPQLREWGAIIDLRTMRPGDVSDWLSRGLLYNSGHEGEAAARAMLSYTTENK